MKLSISTLVILAALMFIAIVLCVIILLQDAKGASWFNSFSVNNGSYWKKGMGAKANLEKLTWALGVGMIVLAIILNYV